MKLVVVIEESQPDFKAVCRPPEVVALFDFIAIARYFDCNCFDRLGLCGVAEL